MSSARYIIEGTWSGYTASQRRVVHRTVHKAAEKKLREWAEQTRGVRFTDGTWLNLTVRDCAPHERVQRVAGYTRLLADCAHHGVGSIEGLQAAQHAVKAVRRATPQKPAQCTCYWCLKNTPRAAS